MVGSGKVTQVQTKLFKLSSMNCFLFELHWSLTRILWILLWSNFKPVHRESFGNFYEGRAVLNFCKEWNSILLRGWVRIFRGQRPNLSDFFVLLAWIGYCTNAITYTLMSMLQFALSSSSNENTMDVSANLDRLVRVIKVQSLARNVWK